jgi:hypothetical protein
VPLEVGVTSLQSLIPKQKSNTLKTGPNLFSPVYSSFFFELALMVAKLRRAFEFAFLTYSLACYTIADDLLSVLPVEAHEACPLTPFAFTSI